jgi:hypothetical protein
MRPSHLEELTSSGTWPDASSINQAVAIPAPSLQLGNSVEGSVFDSTVFQQMLASPPSRHQFPSVAQGELMFHANAAYTTNHQSGQHSLRPTTMPDGWISNSRKRALEGTVIHASKRHRSGSNDAGNVGASFNSTKTHPGITGPLKVSCAGASRSYTSREINTVLEPVIANSQQPIAATLVLADNVKSASSSSTFTGIPIPTTLKPHTQFECIYYSSTVCESPYIVEQTKIIAVKTTLSIGGRRETTHDHHEWIRTLTREPREITDETFLRVNDILVSKKTRFPRVRKHRDNGMIRHQAHYPLLARINPCSTGYRRQLSHL